MRFLQLLLVLALPSLPGAAGAAARIDPAASAEAAASGRARVIVHLAAPAVPPASGAAVRRAAEAAIAGATDEALARLGGPPPPRLRRYRGLPLFAAELNARELEILAGFAGVVAIDADRPNQPSLADSVPRIDADITAAAGFTGAGWTIVVVDTGVESGHPFFGGRVVAEACFSTGDDCPNGQSTQFGAGSAAPCTYGTLCWHGTHVAGIAAGESSGADGVAPAASLIAIQVGTRATGVVCGTAPSPCVVIYDSDAIAALDYVASTLAGVYGVAAVNMSFGSAAVWNSEASCDAANTGYKTAVDALRVLGIASVAASGNAGVSNGIAAPACISSAIGVGASSKLSDAVASLTNTGEPLDLYAPGLGIVSSMPGGTYANGSGTSMATPHVAGAFAVLRQADPWASVSDLKSALETTGVPLARSGFVRPRIDVDDAVRARAPAACFDGLDNDSDGRIDVDGFGGTPDPECALALDNSEHVDATVGCGVGPELALLLPLLAALRRGNRRRAAGFQRASQGDTPWHARRCSSSASPPR
jgi:subtilisin family serine protease